MLVVSIKNFIIDNKRFKKTVIRKINFNVIVVGGRVPKIDEDTLKILSEEALIVYLNNIDQLKNLYSQFIHQNFNAGKKV